MRNVIKIEFYWKHFHGMMPQATWFPLKYVKINNKELHINELSNPECTKIVKEFIDAKSIRGFHCDKYMHIETSIFEGDEWYDKFSKICN